MGWQRGKLKKQNYLQKATPPVLSDVKVKYLKTKNEHGMKGSISGVELEKEQKKKKCLGVKLQLLAENLLFIGINVVIEEI